MMGPQFTQGDRNRFQDIRFIAKWMDSQFTLPNGWTIGWDGILGLFPGIGNLVSNGFSFYILVRAAGSGLPPIILARMALNILIDNILDKIPILGFFLDFFWKANIKNIALLDEYDAKPSLVKKSSGWVVGLSLSSVALFFLSLMALTFYFLFWVIKEISTISF